MVYITALYLQWLFIYVVCFCPSYCELMKTRDQVVFISIVSPVPGMGEVPAWERYQEGSVTWIHDRHPCIPPWANLGLIHSSPWVLRSVIASHMKPHSWPESPLSLWEEELTQSLALLSQPLCFWSVASKLACPTSPFSPASHRSSGWSAPSWASATLLSGKMDSACLPSNSLFGHG